MASVKITLVRPDTTFDWFSFPAENIEYYRTNFSSLTPEVTVSEDNLILVRIRSGDLALCTQFYNDLNDPGCVLYNRRAVYETNGISYTYELIE